MENAELPDLCRHHLLRGDCRLLVSWVFWYSDYLGFENSLPVIQITFPSIVGFCSAHSAVQGAGFRVIYPIVQGSAASCREWGAVWKV